LVGNWRERDHWGDLGIDGLGMWHVWVRRGRCIGSCWGNWREGDHWGDLGIDGLGMWHVWLRIGVYRVLVGKLEGRRPLGRPRYNWVGHVARMGEERGVYRVLVGKLEGRRPLGYLGIIGLGMWHVCLRREGCIGSWWGNWREGDHWGDLVIIGLGHVARMAEERGVYRFLVGKPQGRRPLGILRHRWVDNIRMDLQ